jgi:hypothetical protein
MTKKETNKSSPKKQSTSNTGINRRQEFRLPLPLRAQVDGKKPDGQSFSEETTIENISSVGAYFGLNSLITVGTRLQLNIHLPSTLTEGKKLNLKLLGQVIRLEKNEEEGKIQGVALNFDEEFKNEDFPFITE